MLATSAYANEEQVFGIPSLCKAEDSHGDFILDVKRKSDDWSARAHPKAGVSNPIPELSFPVLKFSIVKSPNPGKEAVLLTQEIKFGEETASIFIISDITDGELENHSVNLFLGPSGRGRTMISADCSWIEDNESGEEHSQ